MFLLLNTGFSDRRSCLTVVSAGVTVPLLKRFLPAPPARSLYWGSVSRGQARQINHGLPRLNAAIGDLRRATPHRWQLPFPAVTVTGLFVRAVVLALHYTEHARFLEQNKRPAFILRSFHLCVSLPVLGASERIFVRTTSRSRPLAYPRCTGSMAGCVHRQRETLEAPSTPR